MKKQIIILLLFPIQLSAQNKDPNPHFRKLKISVPCSQEFADNYQGKWLIPPGELGNSPTRDFSQGAMKRLHDIQNLSVQAYPQPTGADAYWSGIYTTFYFAEKVKYISEDGRTSKESMLANPVPVKGWQYHFVLFPWYCDDENKNQIMNGYPDMADGDGITITANNDEAIVNGTIMEDDIGTINGQEIKYKMPVIGKWKGYDVMCQVAAQLSNTRHVLISRNGTLPYIPVTRKQYLEKAVAYITKTYSEWISLTDKDPDKDQAAANKKRMNNDKADVLKKYQEAVEESTKKGLLDSPAIIQRLVMFPSDESIFSTEADGGRMLVIDNPNYYRKDLPGYVPQLFVLEWTWGRLKLAADFRRAIEENFPIENLQEMIDK